MPKSPTSTHHTITINPALLAFKPRPLQLATLNMKPTKTKGPLLHAVATFLETNGFSKTLKKFLSEAEIEKSGLKDSILDLEEMYSKYSDMRNYGGTNVSSQKEKEALKERGQLLGETDKSCKEKKKKKSKIAYDSLADATVEKFTEAAILKEKCVSDSETEKKPKDKKKKKNKSNPDSVSDSVEQHGLEGKKDANGIGKSIADENSVDEKNIKPKGKKKNKDGLASESFAGEDVNATDKENKDSKKRKRLASEGNDLQPADNREDAESKRRKVEGLKASKGSDQPENGNDSRGENGQVGPDALPKTSVVQSDGLANGNIDKSAEKSSIKKSMKKQQNGSAEPRTLKAFQRVKADEVEFTDERLRDNSYWAKDGAEIGYGAKAQEILGQVRGRDFRHEKTKKKRGSYRGGQIDLQSHSVKFNYSDED